MSSADKAALVKGAEAIRKAESEAKASTAGQHGKVVSFGKRKLTGRIEDTVAEIIRLHDEIMSAARMSLDKAIHAGKLLSRVRASRRGKWLEWIEEHLPFAQRTAYNYISCYERRAALKVANVASLSDAYALLNPPARKKTDSVKTESVTDGGKAIQFAGETAMQHSEAEPESAEPTQPQRKSYSRVMREIREAGSERALERAQIKIDKELTATVQQISRQSHAAWGEFPARLRTQGEVLIAEGERLSGAKITSDLTTKAAD
jgi:DUF3102 family protein